MVYIQMNTTYFSLIITNKIIYFDIVQRGHHFNGVRVNCVTGDPDCPTHDTNYPAGSRKRQRSSHLTKIPNVRQHRRIQLHRY